MEGTQGGGWRWRLLNLICADDGSVAAPSHQLCISLCVCVLYNSVIKLPLGPDCGPRASYLCVRCVGGKAPSLAPHQWTQSSFSRDRLWGRSSNSTLVVWPGHNLHSNVQFDIQISCLLLTTPGHIFHRFTVYQNSLRVLITVI